MENSTEPSSSLSFNSSSQWSHGSADAHNPTCVSPGSDGACPCPEVISLTKLSSSLEQLLSELSFDYSDATIIVEDRSVGVHRCILGTRSEFFCGLFRRKKGSPENDSRKPKYRIEGVLPYGRIGYEAFMIFLGYVYTGWLKAFPIERQLVNFVSRARTEDVIPVLNVAHDCQLNQLLGQCVDRVSLSDLDAIHLEKGLPQHIADKIRLLRKNGEAESVIPDPMLNKKKKRRRIGSMIGIRSSHSHYSHSNNSRHV